jgi:hypothetical protein
VGTHRCIPPTHPCLPDRPSHPTCSCCTWTPIRRSPWEPCPLSSASPWPPTSTRYVFRGTFARGIFWSAPKSFNLGHFDHIASNSSIIWGTLVKVSLIRRLLGHFEELPQKIAIFWGTLIEMPLKMLILGHFNMCPKRWLLGTFRCVSKVYMHILHRIELTGY